MESSYNNKIYKYSIRDTTEPLGDGSESSSSGGSGNYSTAQLTINNAIIARTGGAITANGPCIDNISLSTPLLAPSTFVQPGETKTITVLLYKGRCAFGIMPYDDTTYFELDYAYEGDVYQQTLESVGGRYHIITGDAAITVSGGGR